MRYGLLLVAALSMVYNIVVLANGTQYFTSHVIFLIASVAFFILALLMDEE